MNEPTPDYSNEDLAVIHRAIAPPSSPPPKEILAGKSSAPPPWMRPFWKLVGLESDLLMRIASDPWVQALSHYAFFPAVWEWRRQGRSIPELRTTSRTRGPVAILLSDDDHLAIKPFQNSREDEIARIAAHADVGPRQFPSLPGYLSERFAGGAFFTDLPVERRDPGTMRSVGLQLGRMLGRLHDAGLYYNDATLSDPEGRSHLIVADDGSCTLIDFGVSILLDRHPDYSQEQVHNFVRTLPMYRVFAGMIDTPAELDEFLRGYAQRMAQASRREILSRDLQFAQQGLSIAARRMGQHIVPPLREGFLEAYRPPPD